jgi:mono/diheme cytochrome c family protein
MNGSPDLSKKAVQSQWTDQQMTKAIMDGTKRMPPYKAKMNAAQVADLVAYTRSLGK